MTDQASAATEPHPPFRACTLLDVTLRDGGFHNNWDFDPAAVRAYLKAMDEARIDWAEIGYRSLERKGFAGALRYSDETYLQTLPLLRHTQLAVMVDAKEFAGSEALLDGLFVDQDRSRIGLVRVATRPSELETTLLQVERLNARGYKTTINLMAWAAISEADRAPLLTRLAGSRADVTYIADSYGSMHPEEVTAAVVTWQQVVSDLGLSQDARPFGVHLHNNLELAFANALAAKKAGATWIDASVLGMGRGPGNLKTEILLQHFETRRQHPTYRTAPVYELISQVWARLSLQYGWGPSAPYVLSGYLAVHPSYAQELLESGRYTIAEVTAILHSLFRAGTGRSFSRASLDDAISARPTELPKSATRRSERPGARPRLATEPNLAAIVGADLGPSGYPRLAASQSADWSQREVLVLGRGPSVTVHAEAVNRYIAAFQPIVLECNHIAAITASVDHFSCFIVLANAQSMVADVLAAGKQVLLGSASRQPLSVAPTHTTSASSDSSVFVETYAVHAGRLVADPCTLPADVVSMFAIAQALRLGATKIRVVGFDGYEPVRMPGPGATPPLAATAREQRMQQELKTFFALVGSAYPSHKIASLTPTCFALEVLSIYGELALGQGRP